MSDGMKISIGCLLAALYSILIIRLVGASREVQVVDREIVVQIPVILQRVESIKPVSELYWDDEDLHYLTEALYFESSIETLDCQAAVGYTIMNRVKRRGNSVKDTIWAYRQFSYTQDGKHERMSDEPARRRAEAVAKLVLNGFARDKTQGGEYFYNPDIVKWKFASNYEVTMKCNHHLFLK